MSSTIAPDEVRSLLKTVNSNSHLNRQLQRICTLHGLSRGGVKADLQNRISTYIHQLAANNNVAVFYDLKRQFLDLSHSPRRSPTVAATPPSRPHNYHAPPAMPGFHSPFGGLGHALTFKPSPFYTVESRIGDVRVCEVMNHHRNTVTIPLKAQDYPELSKCETDKSYRVMVFCAGEPTGSQEISFPHQAELKVNGDDVKANLRGLKNKPGSTRPVDITDYLRLKLSHYSNTVSFTYALTSKKFYLVVQICKAIGVNDLVARIRNGHKITKSSVIQNMATKANDADIEATSQVLSLKCPLSYMRLKLPCRGTACSHLQCFDATSYLQLQEQGPQWVCPICNKQTRFEHLAVDEYVLDILSNTPGDAEQVTIEPDGQWKAQGARSEARSNDVIDELEISDVKPHIGTSYEYNGTPARSIQSIGTPSMAASRESTANPRSTGASAKRPAPPIIDLTGDSDEEDTAQRPAKRQQLNYNGSSSYHSYY